MYKHIKNVPARLMHEVKAAKQHSYPNGEPSSSVADCIFLLLQTKRVRGNIHVASSYYINGKKWTAAQRKLYKQLVDLAREKSISLTDAAYLTCKERGIRCYN